MIYHFKHDVTRVDQTLVYGYLSIWLIIVKCFVIMREYFILMVKGVN